VSAAAPGRRGVVRSADGTRIAWRREGGGPPIVLVHGTLGDAHAWDALAAQLSARFELVVYDRRGRGDSGPGAEPYALAREVDDLAAVLADVGEGATLFGHSFGGAVALELARTAPGTFARLVLYEPPLGALRPAGARRDLAACRQLIEQGRREEGLALGIERLSSVTPDELAAVRASPTWALFVQRADTFLRETEAILDLGADGARYADVVAPTLLLVGESSVAQAHDATAALAAALPSSTVTTLPREGHVATVTAPALVAAALVAFLAPFA
jgi:pimeloyl-ACP methyl ester carboxylesterase